MLYGSRVKGGAPEGCLCQCQPAVTREDGRGYVGQQATRTRRVAPLPGNQVISVRVRPPFTDYSDAGFVISPQRRGGSHGHLVGSGRTANQIDAGRKCDSESLRIVSSRKETDADAADADGHGQVHPLAMQPQMKACLIQQ